MIELSLLKRLVRTVYKKRQPTPRDLTTRVADAQRTAGVERADRLMAAARELHGAWQLDETRQTLERLLEDPGKHLLSALNLYAETLLSLGEAEKARKATIRALEVSQVDHLAFRRARLLGIRTNADPTSPQWVQSMLDQSDSPVATYAALTRLLNEAGSHELAERVADDGILFVEHARKPNPRIKNKLLLEKGVALDHLGRTDEALASLNEIDPTLPVAKSAALQKSRILFELGRIDAADDALRFHYEGSTPAYNVWKYHILLYRGKLREAFALYRSRRETEVFRRLLPNYQPPDGLVAGATSKRSLLLLSEGGPGDELRFSTLYGEILNRVGELRICCDPRLETLLSRSFPTVQFVPAARSRDEKRKIDYPERNLVRDALGAKILTNRVLDEARKVDSTSSVLEYLSELRPDRSAFREPREMLSPDPVLRARIRRQLSGRETLKIGIAWRSMISSSAREKHYLSVSDLSSLSLIDNAEFWILQPEWSADEVEQLRAMLPHVNIADEVDLVDDFEAQAALISCLDLVIAPFTTTAELAGAVGTKTFILANSYMTTWRRNANGSDIWHPSARVVIGEKVGDRASLVRQLMEEVISDVSPSPDLIPTKHQKKPPGRQPLTMQNSIKRIPYARTIIRKAQKLLRLDTRFGASIGKWVSGESTATHDQSVSAVAHHLVRQKVVLAEHIRIASENIARDRGATMLAVKAALEYRAGQLDQASASAAALPSEPKIDDKALASIRTEMADLGRHDLAVLGLRKLLQNATKPLNQPLIRLGNAEFERQAWTYLTEFSARQADTPPNGYVVIFGLNNRVTVGLMTPISFSLTANGYCVCATSASTMRRSSRRELEGISAAVRYSGLSLTDEPYRCVELRNPWNIDLERKTVSCDGINYYTFFEERLARQSNSFRPDFGASEVLTSFETLLKRSDIALTICKRLVGLASLGKPIRVVSMDTHFAPAGIVRRWCETVGRNYGIHLVSISISYENYFSNLTSLEARTISVEDMTAQPTLRHPLFGGRRRFEDFLARHPEYLTRSKDALAHIVVNRSRTENGDAEYRSSIKKTVEKYRRNGRRVFSAFGKVLIDFAAPDDHGHVFSDFADWIKHLVSSISETDNLLLIKPHPHEIRSEIATPGVQTLRDLLPETLPENVIFLSHSAFNAYELADLVDLGFVWNGTAYAEFPVLGKPMIAESIWAERDYPINACRLNSKSEYQDVLQGKTKVHPKEETRARAAAYLLFLQSPDVAIPFGYFKRAGTNQSTGASAFIAQDMERLGQIEDAGLKLAASRFFEFPPESELFPPR